MRIPPFIWFIWLCCGLACHPEPMPELADAPYALSVPEGFPMPEIPEENQLTVKRVELGRMLFYDPVLSLDSSLSCASCHLADAGFADHHPLAVGIEGRVGFRNAPTLTNVAYHPYFFREGGSPTLEQQVLGPICNNDEFGFNAAELAKRLVDHPVYEPLAQLTYGREMSLYVLTRAIASFERTMISGNSPYDQLVQQGNEMALSEQAKQGMELFFSEKTNCTQCHRGHDFSTYAFENNGLYAEFEDKGRYRVSLDSADIGKFKVPTLRNIALTAPYMVDGSMESLAAVVEHYNEGGQGHFNQSPFVKPLGLSAEEKQALIAFLESLTDREFVENPEFILN